MKLFAQYRGLKKENYILFFGRIATNLGAMIWPMMTLILNKKLGLNATQTALFIIVSGVMFLPANLWGGYIADRFHKKKVIIFCDILSIILFVVSGLIPLSLFSICVLLVGAFFQTLEGPAYQAMVADITPQDKREKAFSLLYLGGNIGLILSPVIAGLLFNEYLWLCFVISGLSICVSTVLIGFFVNDVERKHEEEPASEKEKGAQDETIWKIIKNSRALMIFIVALSFYQGAYAQFGYLMPLDISKAYPENGSVIYGMITSVNCVIVVLFTPVITMVMEKVTLTKKYALGTIFQALSFASFLLSFGVIAGYYVSITLFTVGEIFTSIVIGTYLSERVPADFRGRIYGVTSFASAFMSGVVEWGSGLLFDYYGLSYAWAFSVCMTMVSVAATVFLIVADRKEFGKSYTVGE